MSTPPPATGTVRRFPHRRYGPLVRRAGALHGVGGVVCLVAVVHQQHRAARFIDLVLEVVDQAALSGSFAQSRRSG
jgi:hypothetical protein